MKGDVEKERGGGSVESGDWSEEKWNESRLCGQPKSGDDTSSLTTAAAQPSRPLWILQAWAPRPVSELSELSELS